MFVRYGTPTSVWQETHGADISSSLSMWWTYARGEPNGDGQPDVRIHFGFADGRVLRASYTERDD